MPIPNSTSNTNNNQIPQVGWFAINLSKLSYADQDIVTDKISYSYELTTSYPTDSVVFQGIKSRIGVVPDPDGNFISILTC